VGLTSELQPEANWEASISYSEIPVILLLGQPPIRNLDEKIRQDPNPLIAAPVGDLPHRVAKVR
jgi:hypothetical protein